MAKILLAACNAKFIHSNLAVHSLKGYVDAYCPELTENLIVREYTINQQKDEILRDLYRTSPDVLCLSCYIWNISFQRELWRDIAKILPQTEIWVGGPEVSYQAEEFLEKNPEISGVMVGEGEETLLQLAKFWNQLGEATLEEIEGIVIRKDGKTLRTPPRAILDLSKIPFPYKDLTPFQNRILYYESSRGCPFSCSYCLSSIDKKLRFRDLGLVKKELQFFLDQRVPQVKFVDRTFNCQHAHALAIWNYIREHDNGITNFHFEIAADLINEEELACMERMRPGLIQLEIGVQSTHPETIAEIHRKTDFEKIKKTVQRIQEMGNIHQHLDLIAGLPYETLDIFKHSFEDVYALRPEQFQLGFLKVLKGAYMYEAAEEYACVYSSAEPYEVLSTRWLSYGEILQLKSVENAVEVYYNSGQFDHTLHYIEPFFEGAFSLYEELGAFYERKGYDVISHSRIRRYEILLEFLEERGGIPLERVKEEMLYDLYWREKLKNRPPWSLDQKPWEALVWEYRKQHRIPKTAHIEVRADGSAVLFDYEHRDALTRNARVMEIKLEEQK